MATMERVRDIPRGTDHLVVLYGRNVLCPGCGRETVQRVVRWKRRAGQWWRAFVCMGCGHEWDEWGRWAGLFERVAASEVSGRDGAPAVQLPADRSSTEQLALFGMEG